MTRDEVFDIISGERDYQDQRWGTPHPRTVSEFLVYIQDYVTQALHQATREDDAPGLGVSLATLETVRKITTMGVACMEQHGAPRR